MTGGGAEPCDRTGTDHAGLARSIGPHAAALADLVKDTPSGSEQLLLQMLTVLTGKTMLPFTLFPHAFIC